MSVTSPYEVVAAEVKTVIDTEFAPEGYTAIHDELHESLGWQRVAIGIAPDFEAPGADRYVQEIVLRVQFFHLWNKEINPEQTVNPIPITRYAERLRRALRQPSESLNNLTWYFNIDRVDYPRDPTGNKTRFVMTIRAYGRNSGLVETTG